MMTKRRKRSVVDQFQSGLSMRVIAIFWALTVKQVEAIIRAALRQG